MTNKKERAIEVEAYVDGQMVMSKAAVDDLISRWPQTAAHYRSRLLTDMLGDRFLDPFANHLGYGLDVAAQAEIAELIDRLRRIVESATVEFSQTRRDVAIHRMRRLCLPDRDARFASFMCKAKDS